MKRAVLPLVLLAALLAGWLVAPVLADFGTSQGDGRLRVDGAFEDQLVGWDDTLKGWGTTNSAAGNGTGSLVGFVRSVELVTVGVGAPRVLTAADSGGFFSNEGTAVLSGLQLPPAAAGIEFWFHVEDTDGIRIQAVGDDVIEIGGVETAAAGRIDSVTHGSGITLTAISADEWVTSVLPAGSRGTWLVDGAHTGFGSSASYWFSTPATTTNGANDIVKAAGATTALGTPVAFTHTDNRMTYTGLATRCFLVTVSASVTKEAGSSTLAALAIADSGTAITGVIIDRQVATTAEGAWSVTATRELSTNDYIELHCRSSTGNDLTIQSGVVNITPASTN